MGKMQQEMQNLKDLTRDLGTPRPDRSEISEVLHQAGSPDGFSMEWIFDHFERQDIIGGAQS